MNPKLGVEPKTCGRKSIYYSWIHVVFLLFCEVLRTLYTVDIPISVLETCPAKLQNYLFYTHSYHISMNLCVNLYVYLSVHPVEAILLSIYLSMSIKVGYLSRYTLSHLPVCLSVCLSACLSVCLSNVPASILYPCIYSNSVHICSAYKCRMHYIFVNNMFIYIYKYVNI